MSSRGELFVSEELRDYLQEKYPEFEFERLECEEMYDIGDDRDFPELIRVQAFDEEDRLIAMIRVKIQFSVGADGLDGKRVEASIGKAEIEEVEPFQKDKEGRFICPHCGEPMESVSQTLYDIVRWKWNKENRKYVKQESDGDAEKPMCDHCGEHIDWEIGEILGY